MLKTYLASVKADIFTSKSADTVIYLANEIGKKLFGLLMKPEEDLNTSLSLVDLGRIPWWGSSFALGGSRFLDSRSVYWSCWVWANWRHFENMWRR